MGKAIVPNSDNSIGLLKIQNNINEFLQIGNFETLKNKYSGIQILKETFLKKSKILESDFLKFESDQILNRG